MSKKCRLIEFGFVIIVGLLVYCINILVVANNTTYKYGIEIWNYGRSFLNLLYPVIFTAPFCWLLYYEQNSSFWQYMHCRIRIKSYLRARMVLLICSSMLSMFIVSFVAYIFACIIEPIGSVSNFEPIMVHFFKGAFQIDNPIVYVLVLSIWRGILVGIYTYFSIIITLYADNIFVAMSCAFVYSIIENFVLSILQVPELSICTSFYPNRLTGEVVSYGKLAVGPAVLLFITLLSSCYFRWKENR